jgi:hypothetical protein
MSEVWSEKRATAVAAQRLVPRAEWFHDVLRPDGSPRDPEEIAYIRSLTPAA